ncbi:hypothetical protein HHK36_008375 [Tetracentron sinense]|uniref:B30.2/SPRY domain-containing protein n=1 Tax=Tetracentron sinense TaxID=13715 RepID=A0A834ZIC2_TETSI|nr:hypothetical protein HHK36_008375 [Tetracentron sinense]
MSSSSLERNLLFLSLEIYFSSICFDRVLPFLNESQSKAARAVTLSSFLQHTFLYKKWPKGLLSLVQEQETDRSDPRRGQGMQVWLIITVTALPVLLLLALFIIFLRRCSSSKGAPKTRADNTQSGVPKLHPAHDANTRKNLASFHYQIDLDNKRKPNYYVFRRGVLGKPFFSWADQPSLVSEAVEHGWSRFAFTRYMSSPSTRSTLLSLCAVGDQGRERGAEISWEVFPGSADFMQKIRLNSGLKKIVPGVSVIKTALPLPGPPLGNSSFPQEAYFEITVLYSQGDERKVREEGERTKLIQEIADVKANSESLIHVTSSNRGNKLEELKLGSQKEGQREAVMSVGLTGKGSLPLELPGSYPGSIGFNSNGSVYIDGMKLVFESEKAEWGRTDKVIGCGFDPGKKKVFFTVDSELVHVIHCKSEEFGSPLYPILAANIDVMVLVNLGQCAFKYAPANAQRTPNPCFISPLGNASAGTLDYEDSREFFSMGGINSHWLDRSTTKNSNNNGGNNTARDVDEESEADLFEIVLDNCSRSPSTAV